MFDKYNNLDCSMDKMTLINGSTHDQGTQSRRSESLNIISTIHNTMDDLSLEQWDVENTHRTILNSWSFLKAVEEGKVNDSKMVVIQTEKNEEISGSSVCCTMKNEMDMLAPKKIQSINKFIRNFFPNFLIAKYAIGGTPIATCTHFMNYKDFDTASKLIQETERHAIKNKAHLILFKDFNSREYEELEPIFRKNGFWPVFTVPQAVIDLNGITSMDDYLKRFRNKYRYMINKDMEGIRRYKIELIDMDNYEETAKEFIGLYKAVYDRSKTKFEILNEKFISMLSYHLGNCSYMQKITMDGEIMALELVVKDGGVLRPLYIGMNYKKMPKNFYFYCLLSIIKYAIDNGFNEVELGQNSYEAKIRFGAEVKPLYMFVKHRNRAIDRLLYKFRNSLFPETTYTERNVFKQIAKDRQ